MHKTSSIEVSICALKAAHSNPVLLQVSVLAFDADLTSHLVCGLAIFVICPSVAKATHIGMRQTFL